MSKPHISTDANLDRWLRANRSILLDLGMPLTVLDSVLHWQLFLEDGSFSSVSTSTPDIDVDAMPASSGERLLSFLLQHFPERTEDGTSPYRAINRLEAILKRGPHAV